MNVVKKNLLSIICGVVALVAIIACFFPLQGKFDAVQEQLNGRQAKAQEFSQLMARKNFVWPTVVPDAKQAEPLGQFPNDDALKDADAINSRAIEQVNEIARVAEEANRRDKTWLVRDALPGTTGSGGEALTFRDTLTRKMQELKSDILKAGMPPTADDFNAEFKKVQADKIDTQKIYKEDKTTVANQDVIDAMIAAAKKSIPDQLRVAAAQKYKLYMDDNAITQSGMIGRTETPEVQQIWYAQIAYWLDLDVANTIANMNKSAKSIQDAPIKRLLTLNVSPGPEMYVRDVQVGAGTAGKVLPPPPPKGSPVPVDYNVSPTGRVCNYTYDVVRFNLKLDIEADKVQDFIVALEANRLLTVRNVVELRELSRAEFMHLRSAGFLYGTKPVARLELDCEALFLRDWTEGHMPEPIKLALGVPQAPPAPAGPRGH